MTTGGGSSTDADETLPDVQTALIAVLESDALFEEGRKVSDEELAAAAETVTDPRRVYNLMVVAPVAAVIAIVGGASLALADLGGLGSVAIAVTGVAAAVSAALLAYLVVWPGKGRALIRLEGGYDYEKYTNMESARTALASDSFDEALEALGRVRDAMDAQREHTFTGDPPRTRKRDAWLETTEVPDLLDRVLSDEKRHNQFHVEEALVSYFQGEIERLRREER